MVSPIPAVRGISATVDRFKDAMPGAAGRSMLPDVEVDLVKVQESGLLKDTVILDIPDEAGEFDTVLVRRATDKLRDATEAWAEYVAPQGLEQGVPPLMALQVPNDRYQRFETVAKVDDKLGVLDLMEKSVRQAIESADDDASLYQHHAVDY